MHSFRHVSTLDRQTELVK